MLTQEQQKRIMEIYHRNGNVSNEVQVLNNISPKKLKNAINSYAHQFNKANDSAVCLFDDTVFGSAKNGFLLTTRGLYFRNMSENANGAELNIIDRFALKENLLVHKLQVITTFGSVLEIEVTQMESTKRRALIAFVNEALEVLRVNGTRTNVTTANAVPQAQIPTNCINCGAVIMNGTNVCEYCGSIYS